MAPKPQKTRVAAYGLITDNDQILLCKISDQLAQHQGKWTLPGGGIEFGESPEEATIREVEEETGLVVQVDELKTIDSIVFETSDTVFHSIRILYTATFVSGTLRNEVDGTTDECRWWPSHNLPEMVDIAIAGTEIVFNSGGR